MKFFDRSYKPPVKKSPSGGKTCPEFGLQFDIDGNEHLVVIGERPIYEIIQASAEGACIANVISRWRAGDTSVLERSEGFYGDFTDFPENLADCHQAVIKAQNIFNSLPLETREKYGMNFNAFLRGVARGDFTPAPSPSEPQETIMVDGRRYTIDKEATNES